MINLSAAAVPVRLRLGPPSCMAERDSNELPRQGELTQGPAADLGRPPPPAAPMPAAETTGLATPKWLVRTNVCRCGAGKTTLPRPENLTQVSKF
jgi:hypothetical protein